MLLHPAQCKIHHNQPISPHEETSWICEPQQRLIGAVTKGGFQMVAFPA